MEKVASSNQAIVIGAGIAGLAAAQTLSRYFDPVTITDRDKLFLKASPCKGVPQSRHPHLMLTRGRRSLDELFPGLKEQLFPVGAEELDYAHNIMFPSGNGWRSLFWQQSPSSTMNASD